MPAASCPTIMQHHHQYHVFQIITSSAPLLSVLRILPTIRAMGTRWPSMLPKGVCFSSTPNATTSSSPLTFENTSRARAPQTGASFRRLCSSSFAMLSTDLTESHDRGIPRKNLVLEVEFEIANEIGNSEACLYWTQSFHDHTFHQRTR